MPEITPERVVEVLEECPNLDDRNQAEIAECVVAFKVGAAAVRVLMAQDVTDRLMREDVDPKSDPSSAEVDAMTKATVAEQDAIIAYRKALRGE